MEMRSANKTALYELLMIKQDYEKSGIEASRKLLELILKYEAGMDAEDVAWVEKKVAELK